MNYLFEPLNHLHLPLLLKWLETPHVKKWWDQDVKWTPELIEEKFASYIDGYKIEDGIRKAMHAYTICSDAKPIGYIQVYNVHDFPREDDLDVSFLPRLTAAFDWYIGEESFIGKGVGTEVIKEFLAQIIFPKFECVFVDSETENKAAIRVYEKAGFKTVIKNDSITGMMKEKDST